jgi:thioredoxin-dependent peroxiredoxin
VKKLSAESVGQTISLDGFGAKVTRHDGVETDLKALVEASGSGVVIFTYPKASTPGCMSTSATTLLV